WVFIFFKSFRKPRKLDELIVWIQMILGILFILPICRAQFEFTIRYTLFIAAIGYLALGKIMLMWKNKTVYIHTIKTICLLSAFLSVLLMSFSVWPIYRLDYALEDRLQGKFSSGYKYLRHGTWYLGYLALFWEIVDTLTLANASGLNCFISSSWQPFWVTPFYGSRLQNKIWNFQENPPGKPDICFFSYLEKGKMSIGKALTLEEVALDPDYQLIAHRLGCYLFIHQTALNKQERKEHLMKWYEENTPQENITLMVNALKGININVPIIVNGFWGHNLRYLELRELIKNRLFWIPEELNDALVKKERMKKYYLFDESEKSFRLFQGKIEKGQ
ncbi:MAG: hypothetical protein ABIJ41_04285, partial [Candidatus Omnitrophota bacterium]